MAGSDDDWPSGRYRRGPVASSSGARVPDGLLRGLVTGIILGFLLFFAWAALGLLFTGLVAAIVLVWLFWARQRGGGGAGYMPGIAFGLALAFLVLFVIPF